MTITAFNNLIHNQGVNPDHALAQGQGNSVVAREPLDPPSAWTRFKAALSNVPLLGQMGSLRQARAECDAYPVRLQQYEASNRQILAGFLNDVKHAYGENIGNMVARDINVADGKPLTARTVSTAMQSIERQQASNRAMNNVHIMRFLENGVTGARARGETDMMGLFLERNLPLKDQSTWQAAMGDGGASRFLSQLVMKGCAELPDHSQGALGNAQIAQVANQALDLYQELLSAPGMTPGKLDDMLDRAIGHGRTAATMIDLAREFVVTEHAATLLDRSNPESMLRQIAADTAREMGMDALPDGALKSISRNMVEGLSYQVKGMPEKFGCAPDANSIIRALEPRLEEQVRQAVGEHFQALKMIDESTTLGDAGKAQLREIAQTRRLDPVQVRAYEDAAAVMGGALASIADGLRTGRPGAGLDGLERALQSFENGLTAMKQHGHAMGEDVSLSGGDFTTILMDQMAALAVHGLSPEQAADMLEHLRGEAGQQFGQAMRASPEIRTAAQYPLVYMPLVEALAQRAGHSVEQSRDISKGIMSGDAPLADMPPDLTRAVLPGPGSDSLDNRGVVTGARIGSLVARDFRPDSLIDEQRDELVQWTLRDGVGTQPWMSKTMEVDLGRATFVVDGHTLSKPGEGANAMQQFRAHFPPGEQGDAMALAVSRCMSQVSMNAFTTSCQGAAFGDAIPLFARGKNMFEATSNPDGSWTVRGTHTGRLIAVEHTPGEPVSEVDYDNVMMNELTFTIRPPGNPGEPPTTHLTGSHVVFSS